MSIIVITQVVSLPQPDIESAHRAQTEHLRVTADTQSANGNEITQKTTKTSEGEVKNKVASSAISKTKFTLALAH